MDRREEHNEHLHIVVSRKHGIKNQLAEGIEILIERLIDKVEGLRVCTCRDLDPS